MNISERLKEVVNKVNRPLFLDLQAANPEIAGIDFLDFARDKEGFISYLPQSMWESTNPENFYDPNIRIMAKPGKVLRKIFPDMAPEVIGAFVCAYRALINSDTTSERFAVVSDNDIAHYYHYDQYDNSQALGSLGESCMRYDKCQDYLGIYTENSEVVRLVVLKSTSDLIIGRALLWNVNELDVPLMDRIYGSYSTIAAFKQYAEDNGYAYKRYQKAENDLIVVNGETSLMSLSVDLYHWDFDYYPYLDTLRYLDKENGKLTNDQPSNTPWLHLCGISGDDYEQADTVYCEDTGTWELEDACCLCYNDNYYRNAAYCNYHEYYIPENEAIFADYSDDYCLLEEALILHNDTVVAPWDSDEVVEVEGNLYLSSDCVYSNHYDEYILVEDAVYCSGVDDHDYADAATQLSSGRWLASWETEENK